MIFAFYSISNISKLDENNSKSGLIPNEKRANPYVKEYSLPEGTWPNGILVDKNGIVWIAGSKINSLFRFDANLGELESHPIVDGYLKNVTNNTSSTVWTMLQDNDGNIWFSKFGTKSVWKFDPNADKFTALHSVSTAPFQMKTDMNGNIWFTTLANNTVGVIQKTQNKTTPYSITEFNIGDNTQPAGLF